MRAAAAGASLELNSNISTRQNALEVPKAVSALLQAKGNQHIAGVAAALETAANQVMRNEHRHTILRGAPK
jgi:hypothetical protein